MDWKDKYDTPKHGLIAFVIMLVLGLVLAYVSMKYTFPNASPKAFYRIMIFARNDFQTQLFTTTMLPALFAFYFIQFRWQMHKASQAYVGMILFTATFMMAIKFL